jgi:hypothetical protein
MSDFPRIVSVVRLPDGRIAAKNERDVSDLTAEDLVHIRDAFVLWWTTQRDLRLSGENPPGEKPMQVWVDWRTASSVFVRFVPKDTVDQSTLQTLDVTDGRVDLDPEGNLTGIVVMWEPEED